MCIEARCARLWTEWQLLMMTVLLLSKICGGRLVQHRAGAPRPRPLRGTHVKLPPRFSKLGELKVARALRGRRSGTAQRPSSVNLPPPRTWSRCWESSASFSVNDVPDGSSFINLIDSTSISFSASASRTVTECEILVTETERHEPRHAPHSYASEGRSSPVGLFEPPRPQHQAFPMSSGAKL